MPTVGLYGSRKVLQDKLPGARLTAAETDVSTGAGLEQARAAKFGAVARVGQQLENAGEQVGSVAAHMMREERDRADQVALLEAANKLDSWENESLYDPDRGALTVKGKAALGLPEQVGEKFQQLAGSVAADLSTDRQRVAFQKLAMQRAERLDLTLRRHVFGEMQTYESNELQKHVENQVNSAIANATDPTRVGEVLADAVASIKASAPRLGLGPEQTAAAVENVTTRTHVGVIDSLLAQNKTAAARIYFEEAKDGIKGEALAKVQKALEVGTTRAEGQKKADEILAAGGTLAQQREKARAIEDPEVRDNVMQRLEHEDAVKDKIDREALQVRLNNAYSIVDRSGSVDGIPPADQVELATHMPALRAYALHRAKGTPVETDIPTYYALLQRSATDPNFATTNLLAYKAKLGDTEFKQLAGIQVAILNGDKAKAEKDLGGFRTHDQIIKNSLTAYGIDPTPKEGTPEANAVAQLYRMLDVRVGQTQDALGRKLKNEEIQQITDQLLSTHVDQPGSWWGLFWPGGNPGPWGVVSKPVINMTLDDIPAASRTQIVEALKAKGKPVSDAMILNVWIEQQSRRPRQ